MTFIEYVFPTEVINGEKFIICQQEHHILRQRRLELNLTQAQVAEMSGILLRQYARIESGDRPFHSSSSRIMLSVCAALRLNPYLFFPEIKQNTLNMADVVTIPAKQSKFIPFNEYKALISQIPLGKLTTCKHVEEYFKKKYHVEAIVIDYRGKMIETLNESTPFWRELSAKGQLYATTRLHSREKQQEMLEKEGHLIVPCGANGVSLKVANYKDSLYTF